VTTSRAARVNELRGRDHCDVAVGVTNIDHRHGAGTWHGSSLTDEVQPPRYPEDHTVSPGVQTFEVASTLDGVSSLSGSRGAVCSPDSEPSDSDFNRESRKYHQEHPELCPQPILDHVSGSVAVIAFRGSRLGFRLNCVLNPAQSVDGRRRRPPSSDYPAVVEFKQQGKAIRMHPRQMLGANDVVCNGLTTWISAGATEMWDRIAVR